MMNPTTALYLLIGTLGAALIAAMFSFFNLISTKELKISEFRQKWIDDLRNDIAIYIQNMELMHFSWVKAKKISQNGSVLEAKTKDEIERLRSSALDHLSQAKASHIKIQLRINKEEEDKEAKKINEEFLNALAASFINTKDLDTIEYNAHLEEVGEKASALLKMEWKRVKAGEKDYIRAKRLAVAAIILVSAILVVIATTLVFKNDTSTKSNCNKNTIAKINSVRNTAWPSTLKVETFKKKLFRI